MAKPRILFIALADSSHTHSWINLLKGEELDVRVFACWGTLSPPEFEFRVHSSSECNFRKAFFTLNSVFQHFINVVPLAEKWKSVLRRLANNLLFSDEKFLYTIIGQWKPDVVHTLGLDPASFLYCLVKSRYNLPNKWVVTLRGGPEFALKRLVPESADKIKKVLQACDQIIADNKENYDYALELGVDPSKLSPLGVIPGTGGIDVNELSSLRREMPSMQRTILWPKAYECPASKALPVFEALRLCWDKIQPCEIYMTAMIPETKMWFETLPDKIKKSCHCKDRLPRNELLGMMARSRLVLMPSLTDGIPNTMYEAMATGAFPIVSPIETLDGVVTEENVLFARNLYPQEIANAIIKAMDDDKLIESATKKNLELVKKMADRFIIRPRVVKYYIELVSRKCS